MGKYVSENVEKVYTDWIFNTFEHYKQYPLAGCRFGSNVA